MAPKSFFTLQKHHKKHGTANPTLFSSPAAQKSNPDWVFGLDFSRPTQIFRGKNTVWISMLPDLPGPEKCLPQSLWSFPSILS
jgi:hypothetical protein